MKFSNIYSSILGLALGYGAFQGSVLVAEQPAVAVDTCSKEALMSYFPENFVKTTLKKFNVPENKWDAIAKALHEKEKDVTKLVETKAQKMDPNPLKDPAQRQAATKLFKETLIEISTPIFKNNGVAEDKIQGILDDIQQQKARQFAHCIESHKIPIPGAKLGSNGDDNDNDDDDSEQD